MASFLNWPLICVLASVTAWRKTSSLSVRELGCEGVEAFDGMFRDLSIRFAKTISTRAGELGAESVAGLFKGFHGAEVAADGGLE